MSRNGAVFRSAATIAAGNDVGNSTMRCYFADVRAAHEQSVELQVSESARWQGQFDTAQREFDLALHQHRLAMAALRADVEHATAMLAAERARQDKDAAALQARFDERTADHLAQLHALERELAERSTAHAQTQLELDAARKAHAEGTGQVCGLQAQLQQAQSLLEQRDLELAGVRAAHEQSVELQASESARLQGQFDAVQREFNLALHQHRVATTALRADVDHATAMLAAERARQDKDTAALQARFDERTADHLARLHALERELAERSTAHAQTQAALSDALEFGRGRASQAERSALERESLNRALLTLRGEAARDAAAASERLAAAERRLGESTSALRQRDEQVGSLMTHLAAAVGEFTLTSERLDRARSAALRDRDRLEAEGEFRHERAAREHEALRHRLAHQEALTRDQASEHARRSRTRPPPAPGSSRPRGWCCERR